MSNEELKEIAHDNYLGSTKVNVATDGHIAYKQGFIDGYKYFQEQQNRSFKDPLDPKNYNQELVYPPNSIKD